MSKKADAPQKVVQLIPYRKWLAALCADGSIWLGRDRKGTGWGWRRLPALPAPVDLVGDMITREAVRLYRNSTQSAESLDEFSKRMDEKFKSAGAKIGAQLRIRLPNDA